jgi:hypothetical protein
MTEERNKYGIPTMPSRLDSLEKSIHNGYRGLAWFHRQAAAELPIGVSRATHETRAACLELVAADYKGG